METELLEQKGVKKTVLLDGEPFCRCYSRDLELAGIRPGTDTDPSAIECLCSQILLPRAKKRSLNLLGKQPYTKQAMQKKLTTDGYPDAVIEKTILYLEGYHYLEDETFGLDYALYWIRRMSERELVQKMKQKGFERETIRDSIDAAKQRLLEEAEEQGEQYEKAELTAIRSFLRKKGVGTEELDEARKQKLIMALFRKGFQLSDIKQVFSELGTCCEELD